MQIKNRLFSALVQWVRQPAADRALMPGAISRFGVMPALPNLSDDVAAAIAAFLYEEKMEKPGWYEEHFNKEHGTGNGARRI